MLQKGAQQLLKNQGNRIPVGTSIIGRKEVVADKLLKIEVNDSAIREEISFGSGFPFISFSR